MWKISELLVDYSLNTPPAKVGLKTAKEFLAQRDVSDRNVALWPEPSKKEKKGGSDEN